MNQAADAIVNYLKLESPLGEGATREMATAALRQVVDQYEGTGVTHVFWNVCYQRAAYRSAVWPSYWDVDNPEQNTASWPRKYYELHKLGIDDAFAILIPRCRQRGIATWASLRMNDMHYAGDPTKIGPLWHDHPELRIRANGGFDYARPEVHAHYLKLIDEVLHRYDLDGVELDWMRFVPHFKPEDLPRGGEILIGFMRKVRAMTAAAEARLGHPVKIAARVPATPEFARGFGLDGAAWARQRLVDILIPCSTWKPSYADVPVERWRAEIGPKGQTTLLTAGTDLWIRCAPRGRFMSSSMETLCGFAASMLDRGSDGIYLFNHFQSVDWPLWYRTPAGQRKYDNVTGDPLRVAGDLAAAAGRPRRHVLTFHDPVPAGSEYRRPMPSNISHAQPAAMSIHTGPRPTSGRYIVRVGLDPSEDLRDAKLTVRLNGTVCQAIDDLPQPAKPDPRPEQPRLNVGEVAPRVLQFEAPLSAVARGYNAVELSVAQGAPQTVVWLEVYVGG